MAETGPSAPPAGALASPPPSPLARAEHFVWHTARVLEQRLFAHRFRGGGAEAVLTALDAYRNADGGYGHALDPALRGPASRPAHAARALRVLDAVGCCGGQRVERLCGCLATASAADGALPAADGPRGDLLATAPVVGLLHGNEVWHAWLFRATDFCWQAIDALTAPGAAEVRAALVFLDRVPDRTRAEEAAARLGRLVRESHLAAVPGPDDAVPGPYDTDARARRGACLPHCYAPAPRSLARAWFSDAEMARSLDRLAAAQEEDGGWPLDHPHEATSAARTWTVEARPEVTIEALGTLRAYGRSIH
ncbi:hypothetical protein [Streptomyces sp. NPDC003717]|uniref:hypothetical protein n=1 Tax=Streptomyces sp. NPDC003717 TaxID=3154276 RepID=UPI0033B23681